MVRNFYEAVTSPELTSSLDSETAGLMRSLFRLYSLHTLERESSEFFSSAAVTVRQIGLTQTNEVMKLLDQIRPHAVRLVDAWQIPDWQLDSSLGRSDGNVYPDLFRRASQENPVNDLVFDPYPWNENVLKNAAPKSKL